MSRHDPRRAGGPEPGLPRALGNLGRYLASREATDPFWDDLDRAAQAAKSAGMAPVIRLVPPDYGKARTILLLVCAASPPGSDAVCYLRPGHLCNMHKDPDGRTWHD